MIHLIFKIFSINPLGAVVAEMRRILDPLTPDPKIELESKQLEIQSSHYCCFFSTPPPLATQARNCCKVLGLD